MQSYFSQRGVKSCRLRGLGTRLSQTLYVRRSIVPLSFSSELNKAWKSHNAYFICLVVLLSFSLLLYLVASLLDPGYQPKADLAMIAEKFSQVKQQLPC